MVPRAGDDMTEPSLAEGLRRNLLDSRPLNAGEISRHIEDLQVEVSNLKNDVADMQRALSANSALTAEIHEWVGAGKGFFKVLGWIGKAVRWLISMAAVVGAAYMLITGRGPGPNELPK